jgi:hypothetical protein
VWITVFHFSIFQITESWHLFLQFYAPIFLSKLTSSAKPEVDVAHSIPVCSGFLGPSYWPFFCYSLAMKLQRKLITMAQELLVHAHDDNLLGKNINTIKQTCKLYQMPVRMLV